MQTFSLSQPLLRKTKRPFPAETSGKGRGLTTLFSKKIVAIDHRGNREK
jgi:hypothetical protein